MLSNVYTIHTYIIHTLYHLFTQDDLCALLNFYPPLLTKICPEFVLFVLYQHQHLFIILY